jgi:hypothetical protein
MSTTGSSVPSRISSIAFVRDFLVRFEEDRQANRQKAETGAEATGVDRQLLGCGLRASMDRAKEWF